MNNEIFNELENSIININVPETLEIINKLKKDIEGLDHKPVDDFLDEMLLFLEMLMGEPSKSVINSLLACKEFICPVFEDIYNNKELNIEQEKMREILANLLTSQFDTDEEECADIEDTAIEGNATGKEELPHTPTTLNEAVPSEMLPDFIEEALENLNNSEVALLELEENPYNKENLNEVFRNFHNIKGISGFVGLDDIKELAHKTEDLLNDVRNGVFTLEGPFAQIVLEALDMLKSMVNALKTSSEKNQKPDGFDNLISGLKNRKKLCEPTDSSDIKVKLTREIQTLTDTSTTTEESKDQQGDNKIKVSTTKLDSLIDAVGELVIANSMVAGEEDIQDSTNQRLTSNFAHMGKIIKGLQELSMGLRMVSLKTTFQKMARLVRDLSVKSHNQIKFSYSGQDTEVDRNVVDAIANPLVHMMRNSVDHGIENPEERLKKGKPAQGHIDLAAYHEGGNVVIKLYDDGRGLNKKKIISKAIEIRLINTDGSELSDREVFNIIFQPGFSTADQITDISGRGVGMDVLKRNIEQLRGRIEIFSKEGEGTTFIIRLPLTLAIIDAMVISVANERYIIPTLSIIESLRPAPDQLSTITGKGEVIILRGEVLPLFHLSNIFDINGAKTNPNEGLVIIVAGENSNYGILVDELLGQQQVVIKSLGSIFSNIEGIAGGAILGDGKIAIILDTARLIKLIKSL